MKETLASEVATFNEKETEKLDKKLQILKESNQQELEEQLNQLESVFDNKKQELVNAVVKEVMRKYGNS